MVSTHRGGADVGRGLGFAPKRKQRFGEEDAEEEMGQDDAAAAASGESKQSNARPARPLPKADSKRNPRRFATWAGGAMIAGMETFREFFITKQQFAELGAARAVDARRMS